MAVFKTTNTKGAFPDSQFIAAREAIPEAIALNQLVATQSVVISGDAPRVNVPYVSVDPTANVVAEGAEITTSSPALNQVSFGTHKIALLVPFSNESLRYEDAVNLITDSAQKALVAQADHLFLAADADTNGILPTGVAKIAAATDSTAGVTEVTAASKAKTLDAVLDVLAQTTDKGATPTAIVMRFSTWATLMAITATDGRPLIEPDVTASASPMLFNVPVLFNSQVPANVILTMSAPDVIVSVSDIAADTDSSAMFTSDSSLMRMTMRIGFGVVKPERLGRVIVPAK